MIRKKDRAIFRWLAGGTVISLFNGKEIATVRSTTFAKALWSIWFGEHSVVDPETLMTQATR